MRSRFVRFLVFGLLVSSARGQTAGLDAQRLFEKGMDALTGVGVSHSEPDALDNFHRSADLAYSPAQVVMGYFCETGTIVPADPAQAAEWYRKAAKQGDRLGGWLLGRLYFTGSGVPKDLDQAEAALQKSAMLGDPFGQYLLGMVKLERNDYVSAAPWLRRAAMQGLPQAQQQLGETLKQGKTGTVDKLEAYVWLLVSFDAGNQSAAASATQLEAELGTVQSEKGRKKARDLEQTVSRAVVSRGCSGWNGEFAPIPTPPPPDIQRFCR